MMTIKDRKQAKIFEITLDSTSKGEVLRYVRAKLSAKGKTGSRWAKFYIVTPNPEIVSMASEDPDLVKAINGATFSVPDGVGLSQAVKFLSLPNPKLKFLRPMILPIQGLEVWLATWFDKDWLNSEVGLIKGRELFESLIALANKKRWRVVLLGDMQDSAGKALVALMRSYKRVGLTAISAPMLTNAGKPLTLADKEREKEVLRKINEIKPHLIFVGFGAPRQEKWIARNLLGLDIGGAMVVGGTFDYISGKAKVPPTFMANLGLEWLWRLLREPWRIKRILTAFPIFPLKVFWYKLTV
jgi:N-acetylglucosaminyldiphosphoundecaprenol N-acetyl-beta-D-mannosaminyltransferase